jgi:hypothetical protein
MDLNYLLGREQYALHLAETSLSTNARMAHRAFAKAYGALIAETGFFRIVHLKSPQSGKRQLEIRGLGLVCGTSFALVLRQGRAHEPRQQLRRAD